jgi:thiol-disulfide isomerase/thioredoxin
MKKLLSGILTLFIVIGCSPSGGGGNIASAIPMRSAPEFDLENVLGGRVKSADLKGKVVVVDFWATYCAPCKKEIPEYSALGDKLKGKGVEIIGITVESGNAKAIAKLLPQFGARYPVAVGTDDVSMKFGGYIGLPTTFVVGKDWKIYKKYIGSTPSKIEKIEQDIKQLLSQPT